jgi:MoaA/NifB/PqqE/SkfB family radical SAM enzyme
VETREYKFADIIADPPVRERWEKVREYFFLRESTYDMTNRCNIRCEGCYYFNGDKQFAVENRDPAAWKQLLTAEKERGITFVVLAGAEPSLVPELCRICFETIDLGAIATNGINAIPADIGYKIHVSVWGNDQTSLEIRKAKDMLVHQMANYRDDPRAVFVYTFTPVNIDQARQVTSLLADNGHKITFNMFSSPVGYTGPLRHTAETLGHTRDTMIQLLQEYPETVIYSQYNIVAHTHEKGLHDVYGCSYPRMNPSTDIGLGRSFRQYRTDLQWDRDASCCVPDTDCADCRHYAAGSAVVTARMYRHASDPEHFKAWLDYVDTYLAVWVMGYEKGKNLCDYPVTPPEDDL